MNGDNKHTLEDLKAMQALPLERKILASQSRIIEWYQHFKGNVTVSFSGGKDSTVLLHLVRKIYPDVPAVFSNTGLEYPEIVQFVRETPNVVEIRPRWGRNAEKYGKKQGSVISFFDVLQIQGYPLISKEISACIQEARRNPGGAATRRMSGQYKDGLAFNYSRWLPLIDLPIRISNMCCDWMKKGPLHKQQTATNAKNYLGTLAEESQLRQTKWLQHGCNAFDAKDQKSMPLSFWTEQDILHYILHYNLKIAPVYGDICYTDEDGYLYDCKTGIFTEDAHLQCSGCQRTGCIFCAFGAHLEKGENRFERLKRTHPKQYDYCMSGGIWQKNDKYDQTLPAEQWNPKEIWGPTKDGLGMAKVFDIVNEIYGPRFLRY